MYDLCKDRVEKGNERSKRINSNVKSRMKCTGCHGRNERRAPVLNHPVERVRYKRKHMCVLSYLLLCGLLHFMFQFSFLSEGDPLTTKETVMLYKFAYLPAGLFNRAQVCIICKTWWIRHIVIDN